MAGEGDEAAVAEIGGEPEGGGGRDDFVVVAMQAGDGAGDGVEPGAQVFAFEVIEAAGEGVDAVGIERGPAGRALGGLPGAGGGGVEIAEDLDGFAVVFAAHGAQGGRRSAGDFAAGGHAGEGAEQHEGGDAIGPRGGGAQGEEAAKRPGEDEEGGGGIVIGIIYGGG